MLQELEKQQEATEEQEKIIVVHFEPWNFTDSNQLLNQFFARLANELCSKSDKGLKAIGDALERYSDAFTLAELIPEIGIVGKIISLLGKSSAEAVGKLLKKRVDGGDVQSQKEKVINLLQKQKNRILVVSFKLSIIRRQIGICTSFPLKFSMPALLFTCIPRIIN